MNRLDQGNAHRNGGLTAQQLADEIGVSRRTIFHLRRNAGGPRGSDVKEWREFLEARSAYVDSGKMDSVLPRELQKTKHRLLKAQAGKEEAVRKLRELELEREREQLVPADSAGMVIRAVLGPLRACLDSLPKLAAPHANPADPILAEEAIEEGLQNVFKQIEKYQETHK